MRTSTAPLTTMHWGHPHVLDLDTFSLQDIQQVMETTDAMKEVLGRPIRRVPTLRGKTVATLFYEPSTRTRASFELAAKNLSADVVSMAAATSSTVKGESLVDTVRTLEAMGVDVIVMRHPQSGAPHLAARHTACGIINGGDGWHAHPTQALLDLYSVRERLERLEGLRAVIVGDILHSRVARSNLYGMAAVGMEVTVCGPPTLLPPTFAEAFPGVRRETEIEAALEGADVVMALRLQRERQEAGLLPSIEEYIARYQITPQRLSLAHPGALVMHPGPVNQGVELSPEVSYGAASLIDSQVANGVAVRMALLYLMLGGEG
jgi:aspartate carbamoyltransferase catalytic subunit